LAKTFPSSTLVELERTAHYEKHGFASNQAGTSNWLAGPRRNRTTSERRAFNFACQEAEPNPIFLNLGGRTTALEKCQTAYEYIDAGNGAADGVGNFWSNAPSVQPFVNLERDWPRRAARSLTEFQLFFFKVFEHSALFRVFVRIFAHSQWAKTAINGTRGDAELTSQ
jgi:hypothetical protein